MDQWVADARREVLAVDLVPSINGGAQNGDVRFDSRVGMS